ncbi:hypothetical protein [Flavicella sp.]
MALTNIVFAYSQVGNGTKAIEYPQNGIAKAALNTLFLLNKTDS